jgi:hypothetical protein
MAPTVPSGLPIRARAGDTWQFDLEYPDYPNTDGWTAAVHVRGPSVLAWDASWRATEGNGWRVTIPAASTADLPAGTYQVAAVLTGSGTYAGQVVTAEVVSCVVQADVSTAAAGDLVAWEETLITSLKAAILALTTGQVASYMIGQRQVVYQDLPALHSQLGALEAKLARKRNPGGLGQMVKARFRQASA